MQMKESFQIFHFLRNGSKLSFYSLGTVVWKKLQVSRGVQPLGSGFPIGASSTPVGTRFSVGKSSVLYLCFRLTRERGWLRHLLYGQIAVDRHFSAAVGQADFVTPR